MSQFAYKLSSIPLSRILSFISYKNMNFLILDCPTDNTLPQYLKEFKRNRVTDVVRVCEPTYNTELLSENNITVHDWQFRDGMIPPNNIVCNWINLIEKKFGSLQQIRKLNVTEEMNSENPTIAVHCVAGLGRAPVLVAIALIEAGMKPLQAIEHIRHYRRGAFNSVQLDYLDKYKKGQHSKKANKFSIIKNRKERSSMDNLKRNVANSNNTKKSIFNHSKMNMSDIPNKTNSSAPGNETATHHTGSIFSNINKIFKLRTTKSSPEVGVVN